MLIIAIILFIFLSGIFLRRWSDQYTIIDVSSGLMMLAGGLLLIISCISIPISRMTDYSKMQEMAAEQKTFNQLRTDLSLQGAFEKTALDKEIVDDNVWLTSVQYFNNTIFDIWIPDSVEQAPFLK